MPRCESCYGMVELGTPRCPYCGHEMPQNLPDSFETGMVPSRRELKARAETKNNVLGTILNFLLILFVSGIGRKK